MGLLCKSDGHAIELLACAVIDYRHARAKINEFGTCITDDKGRLYRNPYDIVQRDCTRRIASLLGSLGSRHHRGLACISTAPTWA